MKALITGASSGIGREMSIYLSKKGYDIIAVARRESRLVELKKELSTNVEIICLDLSKPENLITIVSRLEKGDVDVFINNAGFGVFGKFFETNLDDELEMIDLNIKSVHILTKHACRIFKERNSGYIMNVASIAAFFPGPLFSAYYATKAYVFRLTEALYEELKREKSCVKISVFCPGPTKTEFEEVAKVSFGTEKHKGRNFFVNDKTTAAEYAINKMLEGKLIIVPGKLMNLFVFSRRILSEKTLCKLLYFLQNKKIIK